MSTTINKCTICFPFAAVMLKKTLYVDLYTDWQDQNMQNRTICFCSCRRVGDVKLINVDCTCRNIQYIFVKKNAEKIERGMDKNSARFSDVCGDTTRCDTMATVLCIILIFYTSPYVSMG